jgi:hypothetical protein
MVLHCINKDATPLHPLGWNITEINSEAGSASITRLNLFCNKRTRVRNIIDNVEINYVSFKPSTKWKVASNLYKTQWSESASELYRPSDRRLSATLVPTLADRGCHVVSVTDPYGLILGFLDQSRYFFFQVAPQLYSRGWVDPVPDPLLLGKSGSTGNRTRTPGAAARNSDHYTTEAVYFLLHNIYKSSLYFTGSTIHLRSVARNSNH